MTTLKTDNTYQFVESFDGLDAVVTEVQLLKVDEAVQVLYLNQPVALVKVTYHQQRLITQGSELKLVEVDNMLIKL